MNIDRILAKAKSHAKRGETDEARQLYTMLLETFPQNQRAKRGLKALQETTLQNNYSSPTEAQINNVIALYSKGQIREALAALNILTTNYPSVPLLYNIRGACYASIGQLDAAVESFNKALKIKPDYAEAYSNLGNVFKSLGQVEAAVTNYKQAINIKPDYVEAHYNLGNALVGLGQPMLAVTNYERALRIKPDYAEAHCSLGTTLKDLGEIDDAILCIQKAISLDPNNSIFWDKFAYVLREGSSTAFDETLLPYLLQALEQPSIRPSDISISIINTLRQHPNVQAAFKVSRTGDLDKKISNITREFASIPLLLRLMELCPIPAPDIEQLLTQMRHAMLNQWPVENQDSEGLRFFKALAIHCFTNEYVFLECAEETQEIDRLQNKLKALIEGREAIPATWVAILGAYRPLYIFSWSDQLKESGSVENIKEILVRQIDEVREEQYLSLKVPRITSINNKVSKLVKEQYEQSPYPRWINAGLYTKPETVGVVLQELEVKLIFNEEQFSDSPDILIAGCGTGQHALSTASRFRDCNVLAVDLSLSSLSYAIRKTKELGVSNIKYMQADILELNSLERQFDIIESSGVLHHMDNPLAGWRVLVDLLRPSGLMQIGLYSDMAREPIVEARDFIEKKKYGDSPKDIRGFRAEIMNMPNNSSSNLQKVLSSRGFYSLSECRDLLFHVQEHRFTLLEIEIALKELGLEFIGFELSNAQIMKKFREIYPKENSPTLLPLWHQFELKHPDAFGGMYQFWVQKT
ncbi:MAG: tetratricopeptide repeat protein [Gammaproteobacteria bacterium]|nr:tetratricopeptide repeat protein [Gammaproteobacteria bacterium]